MKNSRYDFYGLAGAILIVLLLIFVFAPIVSHSKEFKKPTFDNIRQVYNYYTDNCIPKPAWMNRERIDQYIISRRKSSHWDLDIQKEKEIDDNNYYRKQLSEYCDYLEQFEYIAILNED